MRLLLWSLSALRFAVKPPVEDIPPPRLDYAGAEQLAVSWDPLPAARNSLGSITYSLLADDVWTGDAALVRIVAQGISTSAVVSEHVLPGAPTTFKLMAHSDDGVLLAQSPEVTYRAAERPRCGNAADIARWIETQHIVKHNTVECINEGLKGGADAVSECMQRAIGFSPECASCWSGLYLCARRHCELSCGLAPGSSACDACVVKECSDSSVACTGVPPWAFPDS